MFSFVYEDRNPQESSLNTFFLEFFLLIIISEMTFYDCQAVYVFSGSFTSVLLFNLYTGFVRQTVHTSHL